MYNMTAIHIVSSKAWSVSSEMKLCTLLEEDADSVGQGWCAVWADWMRAESWGHWVSKKWEPRLSYLSHHYWAEEYLKQQYIETQENWAKAKQI